MAKDALSRFHEPVRAWFRAALGTPTRAQALGWGPIERGESTLLLAPTGSGKTLAAFLAAIDRLVWSQGTSAPPRDGRCRVLYVSPLKALAVDIERNLRAPLAGIVREAAARGEKVHTPTAVVRTGDTPQIERARMLRTPPDILITTPESLYLLLTSGARTMLASVDTVIVDEIHQIVPSKRGAHLFLSLERLEELRVGKAPLQRIGLSATQRPLEEVARLLGGLSNGAPRRVSIVDAGEKKRFELTIEVPKADLAHLGDVEAPSGPETSGAHGSIWPFVHERIVELVRAHRSTMIFVNSRRLAERLASALNEIAGEEIALAHHGSVAREKRALIEDQLKRGELPAIVATSSLELGIDMGAVDLVLQVEAPPSVASGLQRIGRAGHSVGETSRGVLFPKHRADLLACAAASAAMIEGAVEETFYPRNPLDVLAQQIVATCVAGSIDVDVLYDMVRRAAPFAELPRGAFEGVLDMLSGRYPSHEFAELRPRITWDRARGVLHARQGAQKLALLNGGTIPDRGLFGVFLPNETGKKTSRRVGELDEEMVFEMREGDVFLLGASSWRTEEITRDRVIVTPARGAPGRMPFWHGDRPGRPRAFGVRIGELTRKIAHSEPSIAKAMLTDKHALDDNAAQNLVDYVQEELSLAGEVPSDRTVVVQRFTDELGDFRVCVMSPFGARVHAPWATAVAATLRTRYPGDVETVWSDDGMVFRIPEADEPPDWEAFFPPSADVERIATEELSHTSLFSGRFRECAGRALLLPRRQPNRRTPLWAQRKRAQDLLDVASRHPEFPILLETYRECLRDVFDLPGLVELLRSIETRRVHVTTVHAKKPSPFAASLLFSFVGNFIYDGDAPLAERRVQALSIDHAQLRELLGGAELRQLLDPDAIAEHERHLQRLDHPARHADAVHDMLLLIGDLSREEATARCDPPGAAKDWLAELSRARRAIEVRVSGEKRFIAVEDTGRFRDALGIAPPRGVPEAYLARTADPLADLVGRFARTHGPFSEEDITRRLGIAPAVVAETLTRFLQAGRVVQGAFLPAGTQTEYCDAEVLRALRRKSLAKLRREVEPVDAPAYGRFLLQWSHVARRLRGPDALVTAVGQLEGCPLPASVLEEEVLAARIEGFRPWDLDLLCARGQVVWAGVEPLGPNDGRIALFLAEHEPLLAPPPRPVQGEVAAKIRAVLERRGAVFFDEIARDLGGFPNATLDALWDMVWAGEITNDTLEPLRSWIRARAPERPRTRPDATRGRGWHAGPPGSEGRWSLRTARWLNVPSETERRAALARSLLERYGVLTREVARAESIEGGFSAVYDVLKAMEDAGRVRRGYFVAERGATQFALPGADDRLRAAREPSEEARMVVLAATDPANPYGAALAWPDHMDLGEVRARPQRAAGAKVVLRDGALLAFLGRREEQLLTYLPREEPMASACARDLAATLADLVESGRRRAVLVASIDGAPAASHPFAEALVRAGFARKSTGLFRRRASASVEPRVSSQ